MCGRYFRRSDKQRIAEAFKLGNLPTGFVLPPDYNVAPTTFQPVVRDSKNTGERELVLMRWGMVPNFAVSLAEYKGISTINARAETLTTSGLWRVPFQRRRCLVPADGFYEWKRLGSTRQPYAFALPDGEPFAFAGLWDAWKQSKKSPQTVDTWLRSFTIITTDPNELTITIHNRMPVILKPSDYDRWLAREEEDRPPLDLFRPFDAGEMTAHLVDPRVGNVRNNEPGLCEEFSCPPNSA